MSSPEIVAKRARLTGKRVRLVACTDEYTRLAPGTEGVVTYVDDVGTVFVDWQGGSKLGLCEEAGDRYEVIS